MPSLFSKIVSGEVDAEVIADEARWIAILDLFPVCPGHLLCIPKHEAPFLADLPAETLAEMGDLLVRATVALKKATDCPGVSVLLRDGEEAGQEIPHVHWHLVPRFDKRRAHDFKGGTYGDDDATVAAAMREMGDRLRAAW